MLVLSGAFAILAALNRDLTGALAGCFAAGAGALELHGTHRLEQSDADGVSSLVRAQLLLLGTVLIYAAARIAFLDPVELQKLLTPEARSRFSELGWSDEQLVERLAQGLRTVYIFVALLTFIYQGSMALYYHRRRQAIATALAD